MKKAGKRRKSVPKGGYSYFLTDEQILAWMATPNHLKLQWLEEANRFLWRATPPERRILWERIRAGEL